MRWPTTGEGGAASSVVAEWGWTETARSRRARVVVRAAVSDGARTQQSVSTSEDGVQERGPKTAVPTRTWVAMAPPSRPIIMTAPSTLVRG